MSLVLLIKNAISSIASYGFLLIFSIVTSKFILVGYGSEINGLLSSVNQVFAYIALLEAGIGTATLNALYKPLSEGDRSSVINVVASSRYYYRSCAAWYFVCVVVVSFVWPLLLNTDIPYWTIWAVIFFQGVSGVLTFWNTSAIINYLVANGQNYVNNNIHIFASLTTYVFKLLICLANISVVYISLSMVGINALKCLFYNLYMRKHCPEYYQVRSTDISVLKQRRSFLVHEISGVIFSSTDTILLSIFCSLSDASIYAVYAMILTALRTIIGQVFNGTNYVLGNSYTKGKEIYMQIHDRYNSIYISAVFIIFTTAYFMILPFLSIYTKGVTDADYLNAKLPILFVMIELLSSCRMVDNQLIKIAMHAKQTISRSIFESAINLIASLVLVQVIGIYGVLLGTIIALLYRSADIIFYSNKIILKRFPGAELLMYAVNFTMFLLCIWVSRQINITVDSYIQWLGYAAVVFMTMIVIYFLLNSVIYFLCFKGTVSKHRAR